MTKNLSLLLLLSSIFIFSACAEKDQGDDRLKEKAKIEGKEAAEEDVKVQNENWINKAKALEQDLAIRHRFYQALKGTYEGTMKADANTFKIKMTLVPSLPPYIQKDRVRQIEEIVADINSLYLNVQVVQWNPADPKSAVGCRIQNVRPDITNGIISIASENCANFYGVWVAQATQGKSGEKIKSSSLDPNVAPGVASAIRDGQVDTVTEIQGEVQPTTVAVVYTFSATRK